MANIRRVRSVHAALTRKMRGRVAATGARLKARAAIQRRIRSLVRAKQRAKERGNIEFLFILKPAVVLPPRPWFRPSLATARDRMMAELNAIPRRAAKRLAEATAPQGPSNN